MPANKESAKKQIAPLTETTAAGNVLVLTSTFPRWASDDTPPFVYQLESRLSGSFNITVLAPHHPGALKQERSDNFDLFRFQYCWPSGWQKLCYQGGIASNLKRNKLLYLQIPLFLLSEFSAAAGIIRRKKIGLVHAHWIIPQGLIAWLIKKIFGVPYIVTVHGGDIFGMRGKVMTFFKRLVLNQAVRVIAVSEAVRREIKDRLGSRYQIDVISMGVDSNLFNPNKKDLSLKDQFKVKGPLLLFVGRLAEKKGVRFLIEAMPAIVTEFPETKLLVIGNGPLNNELFSLTSRLKLEKNIIFLGGLPNNVLPKFYATADIFIGPSIQTKEGDTEGLGLTFIEATFSGCVPIGTDVGGISDAIINNETGLIVQQQNLAQISDAVIRLLSDQALLNRLRINARQQTIERYDWQSVVARYGEVYRQSY